MAAPGPDETISRWRAAASPGGLIGVLSLILCLLGCGGALAVLTGRASIPLPSPLVAVGALVFALLAALLGYLLYGYLSIGYEFGDRTLEIRWAGRRYTIDLAAVEYMGPAVEVLEERPGRWQRFWPGYYVGVRRDAIGPVRVVATLPLRRQLLVSTGEEHFAISPERPVLFVEEYGRLRRALDAQRTGGLPTVEPGQGAQRLADAGWTMQYPIITPARGAPPAEGAPAPAAHQIAAPGRGVSPLLRPVLLTDLVAVGFLALAILLNLSIVAYILLRYDSIPQSIALHWNVNGLPDRIGSPREIWTLPLMTGLVTLANFAMAWSIVTFDRFAARFLLGATCLVQLGAWVALITLI
ncbi:MAG: DUF1648 domain-containing protein [Sphaerobacter sp.]|nr:DUF1648 domain-containing protein [Sphaerobacter sp.]